MESQERGQDRLHKAVEYNDLATFRCLLASRLRVHTLRNPERKLKLLQDIVINKRCMFLDAMAAVRLLPCTDADQQHFDEVRWCPLLEAIRMGDTDWVDKLYDHRVLGRTDDFPPIAYALKWATLKELQEVDTKMLRTLLSHGEDVNQFYEHKTCIYYAAKEKLWHCVQILLENGAKVDTFCGGDKTARDLILEECPSMLDNYPKPDINFQVIRALKFKNEEAFCQLISNNVILCDLRDDQGFTVLQRAIQCGMSRATELLLQLGADPNFANITANYHTSDHSSRSSPPIIMALIKGEQYIFKSLLYHPDTNLLITYAGSNNIYHLLARDWKYMKNSSETKAVAVNCAKLLFALADSDQLDINHRNQNGYTALHIACVIGDKQLLKLFFKYGAFAHIASVDLESISTEYLKEFLDASIVSKKSDEYSINIEIDYGFIYANRRDKDEEQFCGSEENQPLSASFMSVRLQDEESESQTQHNALTEMHLLFEISESEKHKHLLRHPIIRTFLSLKWKQTMLAYILEILTFLLFIIFLSAHLYQQDHTSLIHVIRRTQNDTSAPPATLWSSAGRSCIWLITFLLWILLCLRDCVQLFVMRMNFLKKIVNIFELVLLVLAGVLLIHGFSKELAALAIIIAYIELTIMNSRNPYISLFVTIVIKVAKKTLKLLLIFFPSIFAFAFSFFIIFRDDSFLDNKNQNFNTLSVSLFKTFSMIPGEFELESMTFDKSSPALGRLIFLLFLLLIVIVFSNVLNALAISDTQGIIVEAEEICCIEDVQLYTKIENVWFSLHNNRFLKQFLEKYFRIFVFSSNENNPRYKFMISTLAVPLRTRLVDKYLFGFDHAAIGKQLKSILSDRGKRKKEDGVCSSLSNMMDKVHDKLCGLEMEMSAMNSANQFAKTSSEEIRTEMQEIKRLLSRVCKSLRENKDKVEV